MTSFLFGILILNAVAANGQFVDFSRANPYRPVVAETDAFDSSYLTIQEIQYAQALPETLKLAIGNDLDDLIFKVADNGIGKSNKNGKGTSFGTELVNLLVQQLGGKLTVDTSNGRAISICFKQTKPQLWTH